MSHLTPSIDQVRLKETLIMALDQIMPACAHLDYRLVGTGAALLHGVSLPAADVDILVILPSRRFQTCGRVGTKGMSKDGRQR